MRLNRDSGRLAVIVMLAVAVLLQVLARSGFSIDGIVLWLAPLASGLVTYFAAVRLIGLPVHRVAEMLHEVEKRRFDKLPATAEGRGNIADLQRSVIETGRALEKEIDNLKRIETYRRDFLGNVSHELKTPIFAIRGFAETLLDGALDREDVREEFVQKILRNADRLDILASDLSEIAKIETGELKMRVRPFNLEELIIEVVESLEPRASQRGINLGYRFSPDLPPAFADEARIRQVLMNLVDNGIKYTNERGHVGVAARLTGDTIRVTVSDTGIGIAPEHIGRVTERFYRVDPSRSRAQGGTGLGLAIVKHILNAHGAQLVIQSESGHGTTISFSLAAATGERQQIRLDNDPPKRVENDA